MSRLLPIDQNTDLVTFRIEVNGEAVPLHIPVFAIEIMHEVNRVPTASLYLSDGDPSLGEWSVSSGEFFVPGNTISVFAGYHSQDEEVFSGIVIGQTLRMRHRRMELQITCKDQSVAMTIAKNSRHFAEMTDSDAITSILGEYEISADLEDTTVTHVDLVQHDISDWDFIITRMEANGQVCIADSEGFHTMIPSVDGEPEATLQFGANVIEFDADIDARRQYDAFQAQGWDQSGQAEAISDAAEPAWTTPGNLAPADVAAAVGSATQMHRHAGFMQPDELQSWADAGLLRSRMAFLRGRARIQGLHAIKPGSIITLEGFGDRFNGNVWISAVRHEISGGNWISDVEFGMSDEWHAQRMTQTQFGPNLIVPSIQGLHTGVVTALEGDPAGESRIKIKVPSIDPEGDGLWARIATLDAGASRGTFFLPEIDDEVIVGFLGNDPRHPVILGMVHSSAHATPEEPKDDNHIKAYYSRAGMRLRFDDEKTILTIDTPAGHVLLLDDDAGEISLTDSNGNTLVMSSSGISIESASDLVIKASGAIKMESGTNTELKASAQWKAEGSAGVELNSSAVTIVKGSLVQIN